MSLAGWSVLQPTPGGVAPTPFRNCYQPKRSVLRDYTNTRTLRTHGTSHQSNLWDPDDHILRPIPTLYSRPSSSPGSRFYLFCELCGNGDGIVPCDRCHGVGIVTTRPGGAGVPFYIGNARCHTCEGQGFYPCILCVGHKLIQRKPDPSKGPAPAEEAEVGMDSISWLDSFPDSRSKKDRRAAQRVEQERNKAMQLPTESCASWEEQVQQSAKAAFLFYVEHARLTGQKQRQGADR